MGKIGRHLASLNLFVEADGKLYVTVAGADAQELVSEALARGLDFDRPVDAAELLIARAENIAPLIERSTPLATMGDPNDG